MGPEINGYERLIGVLSGTSLAMVFLLPQTWADFFRRAFASVVVGVIFTTPVREWLEWPATSEYVIASACTAAFAAWGGMGLVMKSLEKLGLISFKK